MNKFYQQSMISCHLRTVNGDKYRFFRSHSTFIYHTWCDVNFFFSSSFILNKDVVFLFVYVCVTSFFIHSWIYFFPSSPSLYNNNNGQTTMMCRANGGKKIVEIFLLWKKNLYSGDSLKSCVCVFGVFFPRWKTVNFFFVSLKI